MTLTKFRSALSLVAVLAILAVPASAAGKRRAVNHPGPGEAQLTGTINGTVLDAVTNLPVVNMRVTVGSKYDMSDAQGKFQVKNTIGFGFLAIEATRSGYATKLDKLTTGGDQTITVRVNPTATVRLTKTNAGTLDLDFESLEFGYPVAFSGYVQAPFEDFCRADGTAVAIDRAEIKRISGPASVVTNAPCCAGKNVPHVNIELKSGGAADYFFSDACETGEPRIDLIARDHTTGRFVYVPFSEIGQVVFP